MYRVIIVDDEAYIRQGLRKILQRFAPQWELVGEAEDGESGLRQILRLQPDLVILDFRMPGLNGIECCERIVEQAPRIHRILLTAYQDFQLAKQAIRCGVFEFITKPLDRGELLETLRKAEALIDKERSEQARVLSLQQTVRKAAPLAQKLYYQHFIFGQDYHELTQFIVEAGYPPLNPDSGALILLAVSPDWIENNAYSTFDVELFRYALTKFIQEWYAKHDYAYVLQDHVGQVVVVLNYASGEASASLSARESACRLQRDIERSFKRTVTIGLSGLRPVADASRAYQDASLAVTYRLICGGGQILSLPALRADRRMSAPVLEQVENSLEQLLLGNEQAAFSILDDLASSELVMPAELQRMITHYMLRLGAQLKLMELDIRRISGKSLEEWVHELEGTVLRSSLMDKIGLLLRDLCRTIRQERSFSDTPLIEKIKQHVAQYLAEGVSLQSAADRFGMNPSYFSRWFKYETGRNFVAFLKECRIEKAKHLLEHSSHSLQEISELVGYADIKHFYRVFKEFTHCSPSEYKRLHTR
ncbi:response regulator [Cohnella cellulosilytica]|uniref:Response regulator n=1 Tax=Cohnella cellulosilytica TaxID=986710 RepID=A0ABW2FDP6_9BACL